MAIPNPERELKRLRSTLRKSMPPVVVVAGASGFFRQEAMDSVIEGLPREVDVRRIDGQTETEGREIDDLRGAGLFGAGNALVVRRAEPWVKKHGALLTEVLPKIGSGCHLVLEVQKLDKRTKLAKLLTADGEWFEFRELYSEPYDRSRSPLEAELVGWVVDRAKAQKIRLRPDAAFLMVSTVGKEPAELVAELSRLPASLAEAGAVGPDELRTHLSVAFESTPFEFAEALLSGNRARTMRSLDAMFDRGVKSRDGQKMDRGGVFPFVASWTWQSLRTAHRGRQLLDSGVPTSQLAGQAGVRHFGDRFVAQVRQNSEGRLRRGLLLLLEAQRELRTSGEDPRWLLERFVTRFFAPEAAA